MLKPCLLLLLIGSSVCFHVRKIDSEMTVIDASLLEGQPLQVLGVKKTSKALVERVMLNNCSGTIDEVTFKHFPKLNKVILWKSRIEQITSRLPITSLISIGSHLPNLDQNLQEKLSKIRSLTLLGNKDFQVEPLVLKNFKHLETLVISEANFTEDCVTKSWFKGLDDLQELGLSHNSIQCIAEDAFNSLRNLRKLDLTYNHLRKIERKTFKELTKLEMLGIYGNDLERFDLQSLASQMGHLELLGVSWNVLKSSGKSAEDLLKMLPHLKSVSFGHADMPDDFKAGEFCQVLKQSGAACMIDIAFGVSTILGYS